MNEEDKTLSDVCLGTKLLGTGLSPFNPCKCVLHIRGRRAMNDKATRLQLASL
jgi:hypothetical protein